MGTVFGLSGLYSGLVCYRAGRYGVLACGEQVYAAGRCDWGITITVIQSMGSLGPARAAMLIVISQLLVAYIIELFGLFGVEKVSFEWRKVLGMAIAILGIVIFKWES